MRILRLKLDGFGALKGEITFDPGRVGLLVDDNERGKSTVLAAIHAGLYGLETDKRTNRPTTPLDRWRPWGGGSYRVEIDVECGGDRYTVSRDFDRGTVAVWNAQGQEVTADFREGKDEFPVGKKLCGLDADEFAKCALVRQDDLDGVVPLDERDRRNSTLHARLENAADTRGGDTNATEALKVLDGAIRKYTATEVDSTGTVDTAIQRLELKRGTLETDLNTLEHDFAQIAAPLEMLVSLDQEEKTAHDRMRELDHARRDVLAGDVRRQIAENDRLRADLERLRAEAESLGHVAHMPANAETDFRETVTRHEDAVRHLAALESRRQEELAREREKRQAELGGLAVYAGARVQDADRCVALASELRQVAEEDSSVRTSVFTLRETLASQGIDPERIQMLTAKFGSLSEIEQRLIRSHSQRALDYQTEVADLERARTDSTEILREIDMLRHRWRLPGWFTTALGIAAALAGAVIPALGGLRSLWVPMLASGAFLMVGGLVLLMIGDRARSLDRTSALRQLSDAQRRLNQMREQRAESGLDVGDLATRMGFRDQIDLMREWGEYERLIGDSGPALRAQDRLAALETRRKTALASATELLGRFGGGPAQPAELDRVAQAIRQSLSVRDKLTDLEAGWSWLDDERHVAEATVSGLEERAARMLETAGLAHDPKRSWADHATDLATRAQSRARHALLVGELIPQAERRVLPPGKLAELETQLEMIDAERPATAEEDDAPEAPAAAGPRTPLEIDTESRRLREVLDRLQKRRTELRLEVEEVWRRYHQDHPEKSSQLERVDHALRHARRFKASIDLARETIQQVATDTHRRWAEFLNVRVKELVQGFGAGIEQLRFGDDLDFSIKPAGGPHSARGKADLALSAGAKDQLYLAVRLAICEYLSRGQVPLPLLLDDPFAASDDGRVRAGMRILIERFAPSHQVLVLTCHKSRFDALARLDPDLYERRVQRIELKTSAPAR
ncbi:MAG TPA: AAA family ATPase [Candidatus Eisenbacteria bacterium]|nr:AAA family ATPase [Candidatus Eisenbacteria bacterium]